MVKEKRTKVLREFANVINSNSLENDSNTPDFILAEFLLDCVEAYNTVNRKRDNWYGGKQSIIDSEKGKKWKP